MWLFLEGFNFFFESIVDLQGFWCTAKWFIYTYIYSFLYSLLLWFMIRYLYSLFDRTLFIHSIYSNLHLLTPNSQSNTHHSAPPWQPQIYSLCLWVCLVNKFICVIVQIPHISSIIWYFSFWLNSLSMIISRSNHVAANGISSFLFYGWVIFHCIYVPHLLYPFICHGQVGCFHVFCKWLL